MNCDVTGYKIFRNLNFLLFCHTFPDFTLSRHDEKKNIQAKIRKALHMLC